MNTRTILLFFAFASLAFSQTSPSPDDQAKFLAGMTPRGSELAELAERSSSQNHASQLSKAWQELEAKQLSKIRAWVPANLAGAHTEQAPLFYFFSGPDILYANVFFPSATNYVMCGLEPVGSLPDVTKLADSAISPSLANLRKSLEAILSFSFFKTKDMKNDLTATQLTGTLPVLYVFLARLGHQIESVELVALSDEGALVSPEAGKTQGAKIIFSSKSGAKQTLYYFSTDLSNYGIKTRPGFVRFCGSLGNGNAFAKAASYLMHMKEFSDARDFLLASSRIIVQDDSGIPHRYFAPERWWVHCYGQYVGPIKMFENDYQRDLAQANKATNSGALPFSFGYQWHPKESSLVVAESLKAVPKAVPVTE
jgi:hypothetical protein